MKRVKRIPAYIQSEQKRIPENTSSVEIENYEIQCPCCGEVKKVSETSLIDDFFESKPSGMSIKAQKNFLHSKAEVAQKSYQLGYRLSPHSLWACNACKQEGIHAIKANQHLQNHCMGGPYNWYITYSIQCADCKREFQFSAQEQRRWYEELGFIIHSIPKRCSTCRKERRSSKQAQEEIGLILGSKERPGIEELSRLVHCYEQLGAMEKAEETKRRIKNLKK